MPWHQDAVVSRRHVRLRIRPTAYNRSMHARFRKAVEFAVENSLLMVLGTLIALIWANLHVESYDRAVHALHFAVNDIGMVFFFGLAVKEIIEATAPGGALHSFRRAAVPVIA